MSMKMQGSDDIEFAQVLAVMKSDEADVCIWCRNFRAHHAGAKCLYDFTYFETVDSCEKCYKGFIDDQATYCKCPRGVLIEEVVRAMWIK